MNTRALAGAIALTAATAGCGVYSVRMEPPPTVRSSPLDLSVSLGEVRTVVDGRVVETDATTIAAIDADFAQAARASGMFRRVVPRGSGGADLVVDLERTQSTPPLGAGRTAYLVLGGPLVLAPGVPFPWDYRVGRRVVVNGVLDGTTFPLAERSGSWDQRVWGTTFWAGRRSRNFFGSWIIPNTAVRPCWASKASASSVMEPPPPMPSRTPFGLRSNRSR